MSSEQKLIRKLCNSLKLSGFIVRSEFCALVLEKYKLEGINLENHEEFELCIRKLCDALEQQCLSEKSIEREHVTKALDVCLDTGFDKQETVFSVINAFDFPKLAYNLEKKQYYESQIKPKLLADPDVRTQLFLDRYQSILQTTQRIFSKKEMEHETNKFQLQSVDFLLTLSVQKLKNTMVLGSLLQGPQNAWYLEDPSGFVQLDLSDARYHNGFFVENNFVLVNGHYEDKILTVSNMVLPEVETYEEARLCYGNLNYFGGVSRIPLRNSDKLREHMSRHSSEIMYFFSDFYLDHPLVFDKLNVLLSNLQECPPIAFIFMGNFLSEFHGTETLETLQRLFKRFGEIVGNYPSLVSNSHFVFVPGLSDPCTSYIVPRHPLPSIVTNEVARHIPKAIFASNPCRIQYCTREISVFRSDVLTKLLRRTIHKTMLSKEELSGYVARTIISQNHLNPLSFNVLPVHWDFDYTLRLNPLPHLIVIGDKAEPYQEQYRGCIVTNPGSFYESGFQFKSYCPATNTLDDCIL